MGPLRLLDFVGLDVAEAIGDALYADSGEARTARRGGSWRWSARAGSAASPAQASTSTELLPAQPLAPVCSWPRRRALGKIA